jgi:hypothetical protein
MRSTGGAPIRAVDHSISPFLEAPLLAVSTEGLMTIHCGIGIRWTSPKYACINDTRYTVPDDSLH